MARNASVRSATPIILAVLAAANSTVSYETSPAIRPIYT